MLGSAVRRAVAAAKSTASSLGLTADKAVVLHDSNKLTLRLLPCEVLARVAPVAHQVAQFELELAQQLLESGCPVAALEPRVEPRVYEREGFVVTLWTYYEPVTSREVSPADYATALAQLHAGMRQLDVATPHVTDRVESAERLLASRDDTAALGDADRELLGATLRGLRRRIGERGGVEQLLHGEPHPGNLLTTKNGLLFIDLETCCRGPVEFRPRPCARRRHRPLSECQSWVAARVPDPRPGDDHNVALGSRRPTPKRAPARHRMAQPDPNRARTQRAGHPWLITSLRDLVGVVLPDAAHPSSAYPVNVPQKRHSRCAAQRRLLRQVVTYRAR